MKKPTKSPFTWRSITESRLFFPLVALSLILLFDFIFIPGFFSIENREGNLHGSLVDIFRNGSTVMLLAIGMTLVIATGGVDLSVGATMAIAASVAGILMNPSALNNEVFFVTDPNYTFQPLWIVIGVGVDRGYSLWFMERCPGRLYEDPTHGGHSDPDDRGPRDRTVDHQWA